VTALVHDPSRERLRLAVVAAGSSALDAGARTSVGASCCTALLNHPPVANSIDPADSSATSHRRESPVRHASGDNSDEHHDRFTSVAIDHLYRNERSKAEGHGRAA
jgi:hypothetical protein